MKRSLTQLFQFSKPANISYISVIKNLHLFNLNLFLVILSNPSVI